ncbi:MAG: hypothetical protein ACK4YM_10445 [Novosphingobium sp.]
MSAIRTLLADRAGAAAVEMGLVTGLVMLAVLGTVIGLGGGVTDSYNSTAQKVAEAAPQAPGG